MSYNYAEREFLEHWQKDERCRIREIARVEGTPLAKALPEINNNFAVAPIDRIEEDVMQVQVNGCKYTKLMPESKSNRLVCMAAVKNKPSIFLKIPDELQLDREIAFEAVKRSGSLLSSMDTSFQNDRAFLYQVVRTNPGEILNAGEETLLANLDIVIGAVRVNPNLRLPVAISDNFSVLLHLVGLKSDARIVYSSLSEELRSNTEVIIAALGHMPWMNPAVDGKIAGDAKLDLLVSPLPHEALMDVDKMLLILRRFPDVYTILPAETRCNTEITLAAVFELNVPLKDCLHIISCIDLRSITLNAPSEVVDNIVFHILETIAKHMAKYDMVSSMFCNLTSFESVLGNRDVAVSLAAATNGMMMKQPGCMAHYKQVVDAGSEPITTLESSAELARSFVMDMLKALPRTRQHSFFNAEMWAYLCDLTNVPFFRSVEFAKIGIDYYAFKYDKRALQSIFLDHIKVQSTSEGLLRGAVNFPVELLEHVFKKGDRHLIALMPYKRLMDPRFALIALETGKFSLCDMFLTMHDTVERDEALIDALVSSWLKSPNVVSIVTEVNKEQQKAIRKSSSWRPVKRFYAKVFELLPVAVQNDRLVAIDIVRSWYCSASMTERSNLTAAIIKATTNASTGWHMFRDPEVEQKLVIYTNKIVDGHGELHPASTACGRNLHFDSFLVRGVSDVNVLKLLSICNLNRYTLSKTVPLFAYLLWLNSFEYDLIQYTTGDAEKRFKKCKTAKKAAAGHINILDEEEWKDFSSGNMNDDDYDLLVMKQNDYADALVEIVAASGHRESLITEIATRIFEFLFRATGGISTRLQRREFESMADEMSAGGETCQERRDRMRKEIESEFDDDVVGEKRGRDDEDDV